MRDGLLSSFKKNIENSKSQGQKITLSSLALNKKHRVFKIKQNKNN